MTTIGEITPFDRSSSVVAGIGISSTQPINGQTLMYDAASNQLKFVTPPPPIVGYVDLTSAQTITGIKTIATDLQFSAGAAITQNLNAFQLPTSSGTLVVAPTTNNTYFGLDSGIATTTGQGNAGFGVSALQSVTTGSGNSAFGPIALQQATTGSGNAALGAETLNSLTTGSGNVGIGAFALFSLTAQNDVVGIGVNALKSLTTGPNNVAVGANALANTTTGQNNSAFGSGAMTSNTTGSTNAAFGLFALQAATTANDNSAFGGQAMESTTTGDGNVAFGTRTFQANIVGSNNTAIGATALQSSTSGDANVAVGSNAAGSLTTGFTNVAIGTGAGAAWTGAESNNVAIANSGITGESNAIRIGSAGSQMTCFVAGIDGVTTALPATAVMIDANGQLGTISSSRRFKRDIVDAEDYCDRLDSLRVVNFRYVESDIRSIGLIAEEVDDILPELVVREPDTDLPRTVRYHDLVPMLVQRAQRHAEVERRLKAEIDDLKRNIDRLLQSTGCA